MNYLALSSYQYTVIGKVGLFIRILQRNRTNKGCVCVRVWREGEVGRGERERKGEGFGLRTWLM